MFPTVLPALMAFKPGTDGDTATQLLKMRFDPAFQHSHRTAIHLSRLAVEAGFQPAPSDLIKATLAASRWPRSWMTVCSCVNSEVWATMTSRYCSTPAL